MRKVIVQEFVTIDGFAAGQQDELDFMPQEFSTGTKNSIENNQLAFIKTIDTMILGRNTYRMFEAYWPNSTERIAPGLNALARYVVSETLEQAAWGNLEPASIIKKDVDKEISKLKSQAGKDIVIWGSLALAQSLFNTDVIDEYQFIICPAILSSGRKLFTDDRKLLKLNLLETKTFDDGCVLLRYSR
jgi:dihydrofolate reductase